MKFLIDNFFLAKVVNLAFLSISIFTFSQKGTYELKNKNGSYCYISFQKNGNNVTAEIFAWWNTKGGQTGSYFGYSQSTSNKYTLKSDENDPDCKVTLQLNKDKILANFDQCAIDHLPQDFDGTYIKITDATAGDYIVSVPKAYFHLKPDAGTKQRTYLVKGNKATLNIDSIIKGNWADVYYSNANGKEYRGYLLLTDLKKVTTQ